MIQVFTKRYFQTDCILYLKILYLAPGSSKEFYANTGFFVQSQSYHLQLSVILFKCVTFFAVFHPWIFHFADSRNYSYKEVDNKSQNYRQSNNSMLKLWFLLSFLLQIILKQVLLLIVTYTIKYFTFFTKIYHCFALSHRKKQKAAELRQDTG